MHIGREHEDEQDGQPERRRGEPRDGEEANDLVRPLVSVQGGYDAQQERHDRPYEQAEEGELHGHGQGLGHALGHGVAAGAVGAEVAVEQIAHVADVADGPGVVQPVLLVVLRHLLGGGAFSQRVVRRVDRRERHQEEDQEGHGEGHDGKRDQAPSDEAQEIVHLASPLSLRSDGIHMEGPSNWRSLGPPFLCAQLACGSSGLFRQVLRSRVATP